MKPLKKIHVLLLLGFIAGSLSACGGNKSSQDMQSRTFVTTAGPKSEIEPEQKKYEIDIPKRTSQLVERPQDVVLYVTPNTEFTNTIQSVQLESNPINDTPIQFVLKFKDTSALKIFAVRTTQDKVLSEDGRLNLQFKCGQANCEQAWLLLTDTANGNQIEMQYEKSIKYFNYESAIALNIKNAKDQSLVLEAARFAYPIEHHHTDIINGDSIDTLIIIRPKPDAESEPEAETDMNTSAFSESDNKIEITSSHPAETPQIKTEENHTEKKDKKDKKENLQITSDPKLAYPLILPPHLFDSGTVIGGDIQLTSHFQATPAEFQKDLEPAYRIYIIAKAFIDQRAPVYKNACNFFVRGVMNVAGYSKLGNLRANLFHQAFQKTAHNLNQWTRENYKYQNGSSGAGLQKSMTDGLSEIPNQHAVIYQSIRNDKSHGHVGIIVPVDGKLVLFDSGLNSRKPGYKPVNGESLLNKDNRNINIFSMPGLRQRQRVSI